MNKMFLFCRSTLKDAALGQNDIVVIFVRAEIPDYSLGFGFNNISFAMSHHV
jgi:hypothetical protein